MSSKGNVFHVSGPLCVCGWVVVGGPPVTGGSPSQQPVPRSLEVFFDLRLNKLLSKQSRRRWHETPSRSLWRQCNDDLHPRTTSKHNIMYITRWIYSTHDNVIKWKHFPRYWPFVRGIHRSPVNSPNKGQWREALMFSLIWGVNKRLSKQPWGWWFEKPSRPLWRHCNVKKNAHCDFISLLTKCIWSNNISAEGIILATRYCVTHIDIWIDYPIWWHSIVSLTLPILFSDQF